MSGLGYEIIMRDPESGREYTMIQSETPLDVTSFEDAKRLQGWVKVAYEVLDHHSGLSAEREAGLNPMLLEHVTMVIEEVVGTRNRIMAPADMILSLTHSLEPAIPGPGQSEDSSYTDWINLVMTYMHPDGRLVPLTTPRDLAARMLVHLESLRAMESEAVADKRVPT